MGAAGVSWGGVGGMGGRKTYTRAFGLEGGEHCGYVGLE